MATQQEIADHLALNQSEVSRHMAALAIDWKVATLDEVRVAYLVHMRAVAAGHRSSDGMDLTRERALTEQVDRELKSLVLAEKKGQLVNVAQLEPELTRQYMSFKSELEASADKLKDDLDALYGIDVDLLIITAYIRESLAHLSTGHHAGDTGDAGSVAPDRGADGRDDDDGMGTPASEDEPESDGEAGQIQPGPDALGGRHA